MLHFVRRSLLVQLLSVYLLFVVIVLLGLTAQFTLSGEFGWKGKYIVFPSSEKVRKEP